MSTPNKEKVFSVSNLYLKDLSYEAPKTPFVFNHEWKPNLDFDLNMQSKALGTNFYEVIIKSTVSANIEVEAEGSKPEDKKTEKLSAFLIEIEYAGVFNIAGFNEQETQHILSVKCPEILFPYSREVISSLATKGSFPQLVLPPMNFEAMYLEHLDKQSAEKKIEENTEAKKAPVEETAH